MKNDPQMEKNITASEGRFSSEPCPDLPNIMSGPLVPHLLMEGTLFSYFV